MSYPALGGVSFVCVALYFFILSFVPLQCNAQVTTNATCSPAFQWMFNSKGQSPCLVASFLSSTCNDGTFNVPALENGDRYLGPTPDTVTDCQCNSAVYSLMSACSACQSGTFVTWDDWTNDCTVSVIGSFEGIPPQTAVPSWAFDDVSVNDTFSVLTAESEANLPESSGFNDGGPTQTFNPNSAPTDAPVQNGGPFSASGNNPITTGTSNPNTGNGTSSGSNSGGASTTPKKPNHTAAIVGAVVGVLVVLGIVAAVVFIMLRQRRRKGIRVAPSSEFMTHTPMMSPKSPTEIQNTMVNPFPYSPPTTPPNATSESLGPQVFAAQPVIQVGQPIIPPRLYNPDDPSTFPKARTPIPRQRTGQSSLGDHQTNQPVDFGNYSSNYPGGNDGAYYGVPEL